MQRLTFETFLFRVLQHGPKCRSQGCELTSVITHTQRGLRAGEVDIGFLAVWPIWPKRHGRAPKTKHFSYAFKVSSDHVLVTCRTAKDV